MSTVEKNLVSEMTTIAYIGAKMGDFERSGVIHDGLQAVDPDNRQLQLASAVNDVMGSNYVPALKKLNLLVAEDDQFTEARSWLGFCQTLSGNTAGGHENIIKALEQSEPGSSSHSIATDLKTAVGLK